MTTTTGRHHRSLSTIDRTILSVHGLAAAVVGIVGLIGANDPSWGDLQRFVIVMLIGMWVAGIVVMGLVARFVPNQWARTVILLAGPFIGIALVLGMSRLG